METAQVRTLYDKWAHFYNPTHSWGLPKRYAARQALELKPGDRVLDVACGTGLSLPHLRDLVGSKGKVTGLDLSPGMLEIARQLIEKRGWKNVEVVEGDAARLPFQDAAFDKVFCSYSLNVIPEYERALEEIKRVLVPGGRFVSLDMRATKASSSHGFRWLAKLCAADMDHKPVEAIRRLFGEIQVETFWGGMVYLAIATKASEPRSS